ncbi:alcohol dehydrogenase zinc-binding domain protein [Hypoxylon trugodes]|uniref:alcohol dehydrogenase zinc-binding domain protein n=1 Tax=Hypoxylon trugodes TaxID=326681 RepID=UPI002191605D|nr:alcohol dehydrogenase zinc-binding domain protein [Hypoxylon trugodes]KAI1388508.1 alcohol dehydrogenase zinc-binding domain protein [Hypoxylon trugodes]
MSEAMKAITIPTFGGPEVLSYTTVPKSTPILGEALIHVRAFGVNHAEMHMRKGEWDEWNPITGLECVGIVETCPGGEFPVGAKVAGVMGGLGRSRPGSYGEFVTVPVENVILIEDTKLPWEELAALPEVYCTAWSCLFTVLDLQRGETLLIRGATSTIGQAALNLAADASALVTATTRREERLEWLRGMGATDAVLEQSGLDQQLQTRRFDKTLNLVGNRVLLESIRLTRTGGRMLQAGWLGGLAPVEDFNPMVQMESGVHFSLFHSKVLGTPDFPLSAIPLQDIVRKIENGVWDAKPAKVFEYGDIHSAHKMLDSHDAGGKIVVKH